MAKARTVKMVVVGDGAVGKTCLLLSYTQNKVPDEYVPTVFDNYNAKLAVNGQLISLSLWDTAGQEDLEGVRCMSYPGTDLFLLCFAVNNPTSLANTSAMWQPELLKHVKGVKIILIGTKKDLRDDEATIATLKAQGEHPVTFEEGQAKANELRAVAYYECSAVAREGVSEAFDAAVNQLVKQDDGCCLLL